MGLAVRIALRRLDHVKVPSRLVCQARTVSGVTGLNGVGAPLIAEVVRSTAIATSQFPHQDKVSSVTPSRSMKLKLARHNLAVHVKMQSGVLGVLGLSVLQLAWVA